MVMSASSAAFFAENFAGTVSVLAGAPGTARAPLTNAAFAGGAALGACARLLLAHLAGRRLLRLLLLRLLLRVGRWRLLLGGGTAEDRKSTRLNSSHRT